MEQTQAAKDASQAWAYAANCRLYENDPQPDMLNVGTTAEPRMVPASEAWRYGYALCVLVELDGDHARLMAAAHELRHGEKQTPAIELAVILCERAAAMVEQAGASDDDHARRRLVAACQHHTTMLTFGHIPTIAQMSAQELLDTWDQIDRDGP